MSQTYTVISPSNTALNPPPGLVPDFQDAFTLRPYWIISAALCLISTSVLLGLRMYTKIVVVKRCRWEDYFCCLGFICTITWLALIFVVLDAKGGTHQWDITDGDLTKQSYFNNIKDVVYSPAVGFTKLSILLLVLRIFCPLKRDPYYWVLQSLNILNTLFYIVFLCIPLVLCSPRHKIWLPKTRGKCLKVDDLYISSAAFNTASDIAMYSAPLWKIWHLQLSRGRKLGMSAVFATGGFAVAFSILRMTWVTFLLTEQDKLYLNMRNNMFTLAELACGINCSCLFILPRLYRHLTAVPPGDNEELRLRKWTKLRTTGKTDMSDDQMHRIHRKEERRNEWENDIETTEIQSPKALHHQ